MRRCTLPVALTVALALTAVAIPASAARQTGVSVSGAVSTPTSYTAGQLAALPQASYPVTHGFPRTITGVSLESLVDRSTLVLPTGKNTLLRALLTVTGDGRRDVFALGELDAEFGNHPAVLTAHGHEIALIVPGDTDRSRGIADVHAITVTVSAAAAATPQAGAVIIETPHRTFTLSARRIAALPARTVTVTFKAGGVPQTHTESGPSLALLLRALLTVTGDGRRDVFALGELDAEFGNHPAVLTMHGHDIALIVPGDTNRSRGIADVHAITVTVSAAAAATPQAGAVIIETPHRTFTLSVRRIAALPARTVTVTFKAGGVPQTHTESGPSLALLLLSSGILPTPDTSVVAVGDDGYGAAATLAEGYVGGKQLLLSTNEDGTALAEPRLVTDGDGAGGRYVSGVVVLQVS